MSPAHRIKGGPSNEATAAYSNEAAAPPFPLFAAHQPALGVKRSVCLETVLNRLVKTGNSGAAADIEREFT